MNRGLTPLLNELRTLRNAIHACNRNPVPNRARVQWREALDDIIGRIEKGEYDDSPIKNSR